MLELLTLALFQLQSFWFSPETVLTSPSALTEQHSTEDTSNADSDGSDRENGSCNGSGGNGWGDGGK
ncbi:hypothetical protein [Hymenobacter koreensis]|uniref:Uncharacterized protein n=1 Tax=Hymenobacter koreensis TaxID=1084523 RepID=A0ABP8IW69_9BACT